MNRKQIRGLLACIAVLGIGVIVAIAFVAHSRRNAQVVSSSREVTISMDPQGRAKIGGITIGNTNVRDAVLSVMDKLDVNPKIVYPREMTNAQQASNFIRVLESVNRAGLSREKKPNPYE